MADTAVVEKKENLPSTIMADMAQFAGEGMDSITADDMQIPFLRVLQALSPEIQKNDPKFIKGASAGDLVNTVTGETWDGDEGVVVIPCGYTLKYLEFGLRDSGGGFQGEIPANHPDLANTTREGNAEMLPSGNELVRSAQHLVMIVDTKTGATQQAICDMKKTQLKVSRRWNTQMRMVQYDGPNGLFNPPMWGTAWRLTVVSESNDRGTWYNYAIARVEPSEVPDAAFMAARSFFQSFKSGEVQTSAGTSDEMTKKQDNDGDDIPF
jgi:hypothetical protein|tara:strand:- start:738 stop:1538 length:801 start_codon:yes stop_codon:yes gene_type:complete